MDASSGVMSARPFGGGRADPPDDPTEAALRSLEWAVTAARHAAELDRRRRLRAVEVELAEHEQRARRDAERQQHAMRAALARERRTGDVRERPAVDLAGLDVRDLRIVRL